MLPLGALRQCENPEEWTRFTHAEQRTMMTLWCMMRSPLMIGGEMTKNDEFTLSLLTNASVLEILKEGWCAHPLRTLPDESVWISPRKDGKGIWVALFNLSDRKRTVSLAASDAGLSFFRGQELWSGRAVRKTEVLRAVLSPHDAAVFLMK